MATRRLTKEAVLEWCRTTSKEKCIVIDAAERFALRTAKHLLEAGMSKREVTERLRLFSDDHVLLIGQKVKEVKGGKNA